MSLFEKFITEGNEKADELAKKARTSTIHQEREEVRTALQYAASFHCLVEDWKTLKNSSFSQKKADFRGQEKGVNGAPNRVVCRSWQISVHEMVKKQSVQKMKRKLYRTEILGKEFWEDGVSGIWRDTTW